MTQSDPIDFIATLSGTTDRDTMIRDFRDFLVENGAERAEPVVVGQPDPRWREGQLVELVTVGATLMSTVVGVVGLIHTWLADRRGRHVTSVVLEIDNRTVEIFAVSTPENERRVEAFVSGRLED